MNAAEVYAVQTELMALINGLWEMWLGGTFAIIVAFHAGRDSLNTFVVLVGCFVYLAGCTSIAMRYIAYIVSIGELNESLTSAGLEPFPFPAWFAVSNAPVTALTFVLGTIATVTFAYVQYLRRQGAESHAV